MLIHLIVTHANRAVGQYFQLMVDGLTDLIQGQQN